jgi:hypothetical protein
MAGAVPVAPDEGVDGIVVAAIVVDAIVVGKRLGRLVFTSDVGVSARDASVVSTVAFDVTDEVTLVRSDNPPTIRSTRSEMIPSATYSPVRERFGTGANGGG